MADLIESDRHFYANKEYNRALELFTETMRRCPCSKGVKRERCTCKNFEKVAAQGGSIFQEAMHTCHCDVGRMFSKCDNGYHIQALESRAAIFEALGNLDHAMKDAEWMLELAPGLPDGYLCVGKTAQLKKHDEYAWKMYTAGIEALTENSVDSPPKIQQLYDARKPLNRRFFRQDPLSLPGELVSTSSQFTLLLNASPSLEHLEIWKPSGLSLPSNEKIWKQLRHVNISGCDDLFAQNQGHRPGRLLHTFLQNAASSLEHLILALIPMQWYNGVPQIPLLPKLKTLKMGDWINDGLGAEEAWFSIFPLAVAFPGLEQLCIGPDVPSLDPEPVAIWREKGENIWPHLKVLVLEASTGEGEYAIKYSTLRYLRCLNRGNSLQYIQINFFLDDLPEGLPDVFGGYHDPSPDFDVSQYADFRNLRSLRSDIMEMSPDRAQTLLSNAINNQQLTSFDIVFPQRDLWSLCVGDSSAPHLKGYDCLCGTPSIHTLGCHGFVFKPYPRNDEDLLENLLLPQFLATFPNLRTLNIDSEHYKQDAFAELILSIIKVTRLKTIYTISVGGEVLEKLRKTARLQGVQIVPNSYIVQWPVSLES
ncbi:uncharacterized protein CPUR_07679 [Claviceps purpurea 20.1]|uniref:Uncharacterized protein n=1 Tax=Claviceps purpurea (strain 20.1) TaxID=1111077 RepID=M1WFK7_CLAP2|nr:uncharacterized protein CPUR_07679 [Claviceps purpurea 20.1]